MAKIRLEFTVAESWKEGELPNREELFNQLMELAKKAREIFPDFGVITLMAVEG